MLQATHPSCGTPSLSRCVPTSTLPGSTQSSVDMAHCMEPMPQVVLYTSFFAFCGDRATAHIVPDTSFFAFCGDRATPQVVLYSSFFALCRDRATPQVVLYSSVFALCRDRATPQVVPCTSFFAFCGNGATPESNPLHFFLLCSVGPRLHMRQSFTPLFFVFCGLHLR